MNLLFTIDRAYLAQMEICLKSILRFPCPDGYDVYVMHTGLEDADFAALRQRLGGKAEFHPIAVNPDTFRDFPESADDVLPHLCGAVPAAGHGARAIS